MQNLENLQLLEEILDLIKKNAITIDKLAIAADIPKSRIYSWSNNRSKPKGEDFAKLQIWLNQFRNLQIENNETPTTKQTIPNNKEDLSMEAIANLTISNKVQADAVLLQAQNSSRLISLLENKATANSNQQDEDSVASLMTVVLDFLARVASGQRFESKGHALAEIRKSIQASGHKQGVADIQTH